MRSWAGWVALCVGSLAAGCGDAATTGAGAGQDAGADGAADTSAAPEFRGPTADAAADVGTIDGGMAGGKPDAVTSDGGAPPDTPQDGEGPTITVLAPKGGQALTGAVLVHVVAEDPSGVADIEVSVGDELLQDTNPQPGAFLGTWDSLTAGDGEHHLSVRARDKLGNESWFDEDVLVANGLGRTVTGTVSVGWPVAGATVVLRDWNDGLGEGQVLASGETDGEGRFTLQTPIAAPTGWGVLEVAGPGGTTKDPYTGTKKTLAEGDTLRGLARLDEGAGAVVARVDALTTMVERLAAGLRKSGTDTDAAPGKAKTWLAEHLWRPKSFELGEARVGLPDEDVLEWPSAEAVLGLTHVGLAREAADKGGDIFDAARVLAADLADTRFDGYGAEPGAVDGYLAWPDDTPVEIEDTRYTLALHIAVWASGNPPLKQAIDEPGGLLDDIASDMGPLYPKGEGLQAYPWDVDPPEVEWLPPTPAEGAWVNTAEIAVTASATDESPIAKFDFVTVPALEVSAELKEDTLTGKVKLGEVLSGPLVIKAVAEDGAKEPNTGSVERTIQVDRVPPTIDEESLIPAEGAWVNSKAVEVRVKVSDVGAGVKKVMVEVPQDTTTGYTLELTDEDLWVGQVGLPKDGTNLLEIVATDNAGNEEHLTRTVVRDLVPPTVTYIGSEYAPAEDLVLASGTSKAGPTWETVQNKNIALNSMCCLSGDGCTPSVCTKPITILATELGCSGNGPRLNFIATDAEDPAPSMHWRLSESKEYGLVLSSGELADFEGKSSFTLCEDFLDVTWSEIAGTPLSLEVVAVDHAGNESTSWMLLFTVELVTPPLWIEQQVMGLVPDDLLFYGPDTLTAHYPFGTVSPMGADPLGYALARWKVVNPHDTPLQLTFDNVGTYTMYRIDRRGYLKLEQAAPTCPLGKCSYIWADGHPDSPLAAPCGAALAFQEEQVPLGVPIATYVWESVAKPPEEVHTGEKLQLPAHGEIEIVVRAQTQGTCALAEPVVFDGPAGNSKFYEAPKIASACGWWPAFPGEAISYNPGNAIATCTSTAGNGWNMANPRLVIGLEALSSSWKVPPFRVSFNTSVSAARVDGAAYVSDLLAGAAKWQKITVPAKFVE